MINNFIKFEKYKNYYLGIILSTVLMLVIYAPLNLIDISYFHSDDARLINRLDNVSSVKDALLYIFSTEYYKFRPIANIQYLLEKIIFGNNFNLYIIYNILLLDIIIFNYLKIIKNSKTLFSIVSSLILATSVYVVYPAWNITGSFESLSAIFFLIIIGSIFHKPINIYKLLIFSILLIFTSEKYLPFLVFLPIAIKINEEYYTWKASFLYAFGIMILYILMRIMLGVPALVGTQTDSIQASFNILQFSSHLLKSSLELFGFSTGPRYLTGFEITDWVTISQLLDNHIYVRGLILNIALLIISLYILIFKLCIKDASHFLFILICLIMAMAASITFRLELRWLLPSNLVLMLYLTTDISAKNRQLITRSPDSDLFIKLLTWIFLLLSLMHNLYYISHFRSDLYFSGRMSSTPIYSNIDEIVNYIKAIK